MQQETVQEPNGPFRSQVAKAKTSPRLVQKLSTTSSRTWSKRGLRKVRKLQKWGSHQLSFRLPAELAFGYWGFEDGEEAGDRFCRNEELEQIENNVTGNVLWKDSSGDSVKKGLKMGE